MWNIEEATRKILAGSIIMAKNGVKMYTPDGLGNYAALWTRDFAYMVEYAGNLMPGEDVRRCIEYLMDGAAKNGWIPDRVDANGNAFYTAGDSRFPGLPNLDTGTYLVIAADCYLNTLPEEAAQAQFALWKKALCESIDCLPINDFGLILNDTEPAHSPYGFTDCIRKTGVLAFESILLWRAVKILGKRMGREGGRYRMWQRSIEEHFTETFWDERGMLLAATGVCRQLDVWASCQAISAGFPLDEDKKQAIARWLIDHYDGIVQRGQLRHLPAGEHWEETFNGTEPETYQNGAFWATPVGWFIDAIIDTDCPLAEKTLRDVLKDFEENGIFECVNGDYRKLDTYVVSATNVYGACKKYSIA